MKITKAEAFEIANAVTQLVNAAEGKYELIYGLDHNRRKLKPLLEEISEMNELHKKLRQNLAVKYCAKDKDGKPVIHTFPVIQDDKEIGKQTIYSGLERGMQPEYDTEVDKIAQAEKDKFKEETEFEPYMIKREYLPAEIKAGQGGMYAAITPLIESK